MGGGRIAGTQAIAARLSDHWDVVAGALSSDPVSAKARAAEFFISPERAYDSFAQMAEMEKARPDGVDAVMVTTPNHLHHDAAMAFLDAGIDVLCDKPLANEAAHADALVKRTASTGCVFGVSYVMTCFAMIRHAREIVAAGTLGRINQIHVEFLQDWMVPSDAVNAPHAKWRTDPKIAGPTSCVGDIGTHAAHMATFVSGLRLEAVRADFYVCGAPMALEDTAFMGTRYQGDVPGTLLATRLATGNRGGMRVRVFGSRAGLEWDLEQSEQLKLRVFGQPDQVISRGHGHGLSKRVERLLRTGRGFSEGFLEAWANLYTEFAMAVAARHDKLSPPPDWVSIPRVEDGAEGVRFIHASLRSNNRGGAWEAV